MSQNSPLCSGEENSAQIVQIDSIMHSTNVAKSADPLQGGKNIEVRRIHLRYLCLFECTALVSNQNNYLRSKQHHWGVDGHESTLCAKYTPPPLTPLPISSS